MGDPIKQLTRDALADGNGHDPGASATPYADILAKRGGAPLSTAVPETSTPYADVLAKRGGAPISSAPQTYDDILTGFMRGGPGLPGTPRPEEPTPSPEIVSQWPPATAVSTAEAATGSAPPVGPLEKPPGLMQRMGKSIAGGISRAFGGGPSPEQQMAERVFGAQAEIEARQSPEFNALLTDNAKLRFLNIFRRRYQLPPLPNLPGPETAPEVAEREFKTWRGLVGKLPYASTVAMGVDAVQLIAAAKRMDEGTGTIDDFELLTKLKETEARQSRGQTVPAMGLDILGQSIPVGLELATGGGPTRFAAKGAEKLVGKTVSKAVGKAAMRVAEAASEKTLPRLALHAGVKTAERGLPSWATRTAVETLQTRLPGYELRPGDDAALEYAMTAPPQPLLEALRDSAVHQGIQVVSEFTGGSVGIIGGKLGRLAAGAERTLLPSLKAVEWAGNLRTKMAAELVRLKPNKYLTFSNAMRMLTNKAGYNGVIGEIGEERIGELMEAAAREVVTAAGGETRLQGLEGSPIWQAPNISELGEWPGWKQLQAEFLGFIAPTAGSVLGAAVVPEEPKPFERRQPMPAQPGPGEFEISPPGVPPQVSIPVREAGFVPRGTQSVVGAGLTPTSLTATEEPLSGAPTAETKTPEALAAQAAEEGSEGQKAEVEPVLKDFSSSSDKELAPLVETLVEMGEARANAYLAGTAPQTEARLRQLLTKPSPVGDVGAKQPWEMTRGAVAEAVQVGTRQDLDRARPILSVLFAPELREWSRSNDPWGIWRAVNIGDEAPRVPMVDFTARHRSAVEAAIARGDPVPPSVLAEYPDLKSVERPSLGEVIDKSNVEVGREQRIVDQIQAGQRPGERRGTNPDYNESLLARQQEEAELQGKTVSNGAVASAIMHAGDTVRELLGRKEPARTYIEEKLDRIDETMRTAASDFGRPLSAEDAGKVAQARTFYAALPDTTERMRRAKALVLSVLSQDPGGIRSAVENVRELLDPEEYSPLLGRGATLPDVIDKSNVEIGRGQRVVDRLADLLMWKIHGRLPTPEEHARYGKAYLWELRRALLMGAVTDVLRPSNKQSRKLYEELSGRKLPASWKSTAEYIANNEPPFKDDVALLMRLDEYAKENKLNLPPLKAAEQAAIKKTRAAAIPETRRKRAELAASLPPVPEPPTEEKPPETQPIAPIERIIEGEVPRARPTEQPKPGTEREPPAEEGAERPGGEAAPSGPGVGGPPLPEGRTPEDLPPAGEGGAAAPLRPRAPDRGGGVDRPLGGERHEAGRGVRDRGGAVSGTAGVEKPKEEKPKKEEPPREPAAPAVHTTEHSGRSDYSISDPADLFVSGKKSIFKRNVEAIRTLKKIQEENRPATEDEKAVLVRYQGWGSVPEPFGSYDRAWEREHDDLEELLTDEEYKEARGSTKNAMYSPPEIVLGMWDALWRMGFRGGSVLETSAGVGHFLGLQPLDMANASRRVAIEKDAISAGIAAALYPASDVRHTPFEEALLPKDYFDVAISNVPFGQLFIKDKRYPKGLRKFIHDYFFVRGLDLVRPGGIVAFVTTKGTMDKIDDKVRHHLADRADLIGAVRLNEDSLPGTNVTADIIFLRKRGKDEPAAGEAWVKSIPYAPLPGRYVSEYFQKHPEMVLGEIKGGSQYTGEDAPTNTIVKANETFDLTRDLSKALDTLPQDIFGKVEGALPEAADPADMIPSPDNLPPGAHFIGPDGALRRAGGKGQASGNVEPSLLEQHGAKAVQRVKGLVELRDGVMGVLRASMDPKGDERLPELQKEINRIYDRLAKEGITPIRHQANVKLLGGDPITLSLLSAIEDYDKVTRKATKGDIFTRRILEPYKAPTSADTTSDALSISLDETNRIDVPRIGGLLGVDDAAARTRLLEEALVYEMPGDELILAPDYMSGNVKAKLRDAEALAKFEDRYKRNVEALKTVQPEDKAPSQIAVVIGAPWIPAETIEDFMVSILGEKVRQAISVRRANATGRWFVSAPSWTATSAAATETWGTKDMDFVELMKAQLTMKSPVVKEKFTDAQGNKREVTNPEATAAAEAKLAEIKAHFETWLWGHKRWGPELLRAYNDEMNNTARRKWDGSHLTFPGMNPSIKLDPHQKDGIYRSIASPNNTMIAVAVGGGKTFMLTAAAMEALRLRLARKVAIVVERATLNGFIKLARLLYPAGNFIALSVEDLKAENRAKTLARMAAAERAVFILPHKQFTMLPVGEDTMRSYYGEMMSAMEESIADMKDDTGKAVKRSVKQMEKARDNLKARMEERIEEIKRVPTLTFEELGIDWLMYDESQKVKNLGFQTLLESVRGLGHPQGNQITTDLFIKARYIQKLQNGRGVVFSTGTPIDNSISEIYAIQRYLQQPQLHELGIRSFDGWVNMFALPAADLERVAGRYKMVTRLREYINLDALYQLWDQIAHFVPHEEVAAALAAREGGGSPMPVFAENSQGKRTYEIVTLEATPAQVAYRQVTAQRVRDLPPRPKPGDDIMLSIITDEKKAALDMRLIDPRLPEEPGNKINATAERAAQIHKEGHKHKYAQLIFVNQGPPGSKVAFGLYGALIQKLVEKGIPRDQIATIYDAVKDEQKQALFERVNRGEIRVLIGSMAKMGTGVNVQQRLWALQQMEPAWTPGLLVQMEGRAIRQGNVNWDDPTKAQNVRMFRYVTKGSSDEFMYSLLAAKHKVNQQFLSGRIDTDRIADVDIGVASFQLAMAEASENKTVLEWTKADQQLRSLQGQLRYHRDGQMELRKKELRVKATIEKTAEDLKAAKRVADWVSKLPPAKPFVMNVRGKEYDKMGEAGAALFEALKGATVSTWTTLGSTRGVAIQGVSDVLGQKKIDIIPSPEVKPEWNRITYHAAVVGGLGIVPSEGQLRGWVIALMDLFTDVDPAAYAARLATVKEELAEIERNMGKPFAKQKELDELAIRVRKLTDQIATLADEANKAAAGGVAAEMGDQGDTEEGEDTDEDKPDGGGGGGGMSPGFGPRQESLLPPNLTPEERRWIRQNWGGNTPLFGMGGMGAGAPALTGLRGWYVRSWEKWISKPWYNRKTAKGQAISNSIQGMLWDLGHNMTQAMRNEFEKAKGVGRLAAELRINFDDRINEHVAKVRAAGIGKAWPDDAWNVIRLTARAVLTGGNRRPENLPPDMRAVWAKEFAPWVKKLSSRGLSQEDYEASVEARLQAVNERIAKIDDTTIGHDIAKEGWDVYALTEHRVIQDVARGKRSYDDISEGMRLWLQNAKDMLDELTDEILNTPWLLKMAKLGGLENWKEIVEMRQATGQPYLQRLYNYHRKKRHPFKRMVWAEHKLLGPRLALGMFKAKRADENLWTVRMANLQERQFDSADAAKAFADEQIEANRKQYGEMVEQRVKVIPPLEDEQVEWLGPIEDMRVLMGSTISSLMKNVAFGKLFHFINETEAIDESEYNDLPQEEQERYEPLPDTPKLWDLAGKYVPVPTANGLNEMDVVFTGFLSQMWSAFVNSFKSIVVLTSTVTWTNQILGQTYPWLLAGLNPLTHRAIFGEAARRLAQGINDPTVKHLVAGNNLKGGWDRNGVAGKTHEFISRPHGEVVGALIDLYMWAKRAGQTLGRAYGFVDELSIVASYIRDREVMGLPEELALENLRWFQNYARLGTAAKWLRAFPLGDPFAAFTDQAIKITVKGMREEPGRVLAYYALPGIINLTSRLILGVTDDEMKILDTARSRDPKGPFGWLQGFNDRYFQPILPFPRDKQGRLRTMDMRYLYWLGNEMRVANGPGGIGIPHMLRQPFITPLLEVMPFNQELWSGRKIMDRNDPAIVQLWNAAAHVAWGSIPAPKLATRSPFRIYEAATGRSGDNLIQVLLKEVFGINILPQYANREAAFKLLKKTYNEEKAKRFLDIYKLYERYAHPKSAPITERGIEQSNAADERKKEE